MWHRRARAQLRLVILSLLLGLIPPASTPRAQAHSAAIAGPPAANTAPAAAAQAAPPKPIASTPVPHPEPPPPSLPAKAPITPNRTPDFGKLPLSFIPNAGQTDPSVRYHVQGLGGRLFFTPGEVLFAFPAPPPKTAVRDPKRDPHEDAREAAQRAHLKPAILELRFDNANANPQITPANRLPGTANFFIGNDPSAWHSSIPTYSGIVYKQLYSGIDLQYDGTLGQVKSTYTVAPGADPSRIRWRYTGATDVQLDTDGNLIIRLPQPNAPVTVTVGTLDPLVEHAPHAWQIVNGQQVPVAIHYTIASNKSITFALGTYDSTKPLTIDPTWTYNTSVGGSGNDEGWGIALDNNDNAYVTGITQSTDLPSPAHAYSGGQDAFVVKLNSSATAVLFTTYFGGSGDDRAYGIALDSDYNAYITGDTTSSGLPNAIGTYKGAGDAFVAKVNGTNGTISWSSFFGGTNMDSSNAIAVDNERSVYITGVTKSTDFLPAGYSSPIQNTLGDNSGCAGCGDAFVVKLDANGVHVYSSYLGGVGMDAGLGIAVDSQKYAYVTGGMASGYSGMTVLPFAMTGGPSEGFVVKVNQGGTSLVYSTYISGSRTDDAYAITVDSQFHAIVTGYTFSTDFVIVSSSFRGLPPIMFGIIANDDQVKDH